MSKLATSGLTAVQAAPGYSVGSGVNTLTGVPMGSAVTWQGPILSEPAPNTSEHPNVEVTLATTTMEFYSSLGIDAEAAVAYGPSSASVKTQFSSQFQSTSLSSWVVFRISVEKTQQQLQTGNQASMDPKALATLTSDGGALNFFQSFGNSYITSIISGGEFIGVLQIESTSEQTKEELKVSWKANVQSGAVNASTAGSVDRVVSTAKATSVSTIQCLLSPSMTGPTDLTTTAIVQFALAFPGLVTDANAVPLTAYLQNYIVLNPPADARQNLNWADLRNATNFLCGINDYLAALDSKRAIVAAVVNQPTVYRPGVRQPFLPILTEIENEISQLKELADSCCKSFSCGNTPHVPSLLPAPTWVNATLPAPQAAKDLQTGDVIALLADNGCYWTRGGGDPPPIEASAGDTNQTFSQFIVVMNSNGSISLRQLDGNYMTRTNRGDSGDPMEARPVGDVGYSQFQLIRESGGGTYFIADNNKYLSRIRRGDRDAIEAAKAAADAFCEFRPVTITFAGDNPQNGRLADL